MLKEKKPPFRFTIPKVVQGKFFYLYTTLDATVGNGLTLTITYHLQLIVILSLHEHAMQNTV